MKKRFIVIVFLMLIFIASGRSVAKEEHEFSGTRSVVCRISQSDLDNFLSGGRASLEMLLSQNRNEWLQYRLISRERDLYITLTFSFESYQDYEEKLSVLLREQPITTYGKENLSYMENFEPVELLEFLNCAAEENNLTAEENISKFWRIESDTANINGAEYSGTTALNISDKRGIAYERIDIDTQIDQEGAWLRIIECRVLENMSVWAIPLLEKRSNLLNASFESSGTSCSISFAAQTEEELIRNTMFVLQTAVNISHYRHYQNADHVRTETEEKIKVESILTENGTFRYSLDLPETYSGLSAEYLEEKDTWSVENSDNDEKTEVYENNVSYNGRKGCIRYYYDEEILFDKIEIETDLSNEFHKLKRTIKFVMDGDIAEGCHEQIMKKITGKLRNGDQLRCYKENGKWCYVVSFQSWLEKDIDRFTERILGIEESKLCIERKIFTFSESNVQDQFSLGTNVPGTYSGKMEMIYKLPENTRKIEESNGGPEIKEIFDTGMLRYSGTYSFRCFHYKRMILYIVVVMVSGIAAVVIASRFRQKLKSRKTRQIRYCPKCGSVRKDDGKFCAKCGYKF